MFRISRYVQPICLPHSSSLLTQDFEGEIPVYLGWEASYLSYLGGKYDSKLKSIDSLIWSRSDCNKTHFKSLNEDKFICAGNDGCKGDSSGSLILYEKSLQRYILVGIKSFAKG